MALPRVLALLAGVLVALAGAVTLADPGVVLGVARTLQTSGELYALAAVRVALGAALLWGARGGRMPRTLLVLGILMVLGGLATPLVGVGRMHELLDLFERLGPLGMRAAASLGVLLGAFIIHAARPPHPLRQG